MSSRSEWPGLSKGIRSRTVSINDLEMHILEAFPGTSIPGASKPPLVLLLHGFPELSYSWRKIIGPLSDAGYHVVAPDQRGYGRTKNAQTESTVKYEDDLNPFRMTNLVKDVVTLVYTLGYESVAAVVGHDFGSPLAGYCALIRPDLFKSVVLMSAPFTGAPKLSLGKAPTSLEKVVVEDFAALTPPRKHYWFYSCTPDANADMTNPPGGIHAFLREYYHVKSAEWKSDVPHPLSAFSAAVMVELPQYYAMLSHQTMPEAVHALGASAEEINKAKAWMTEEELSVYAAEYARTGFQGGLNLYRIVTSPAWSSDLELFSGKQIEVPSMFLAGKQDWGPYQFPGAVEAMRGRACKSMEDFVLIDGAGHWVQQEQSDKVVEHLLKFLGKRQ